jgi:hypothetical protein
VRTAPAMLAIWAASSSARATTAFCGRSAMTRCRGGRLVENIRPWAINPWPTTKATHSAMTPPPPALLAGHSCRRARMLARSRLVAAVLTGTLDRSRFAQAKHPRGLIAYRRATGRPRTTREEGRAPGAVPSLIPPYELDRDGPTTAERVPAPEPADSSGPHQPSDAVQGGSGAGAVPKVRRTMTKATATMAAASPET